jgi:hypothetical protein
MKFRFEVIHMSPFLKQIKNFMQLFDVTIDGIGVRDTMIFTTKKDVDLGKLKNILCEVYESLGHEVLHIQGGQVE